MVLDLALEWKIRKMIVVDDMADIPLVKLEELMLQIYDTWYKEDEEMMDAS
jgi:hypothetical protein